MTAARVGARGQPRPGPSPALRELDVAGFSSRLPVMQTPYHASERLELDQLNPGQAAFFMGAAGLLLWSLVAALLIGLGLLFLR